MHNSLGHLYLLVCTRTSGHFVFHEMFSETDINLQLYKKLQLPWKLLLLWLVDEQGYLITINATCIRDGKTAFAHSCKQELCIPDPHFPHLLGLNE